MTGLAAALTVGTLCGFNRAGDYASGEAPGRIRGAMYFGHEWQINFWSGEHDKAPADFAQMAEDGINTVIFVVPWRAFQPVIGRGTQYNETLFDKLDTLMDQAEEAGLGVMLRVGYTWDDASGGNVRDRYRNLVSDKTTRDAWLSYAEKVYDCASRHPNYVGAFLTWEDFWDYTAQAESLGDRGSAREAEAAGYSDFVRSRYTREELEELYGSEEDAGKAAFPRKGTSAYRLFFEWYDDFLLQLLTETQQVFPDLSLECRLDVDPYEDNEGRLRGVSHEATYGAGDASYSSAMISVNMALAAETDRSAANCAAKDIKLLESFRAQAGKPVFVDQFLYMETTPGYEHLPQIADDTGSYLAMMGPVLRDYTIGYGLWTYRDYVDNVVSNSEFGNGKEGWIIKGSGGVENVDGNNMAHLYRMSELKQNIGGREFMSSKNVHVRFRCIAEKPVVFSIKIGGARKDAAVEKGDRIVDVEFDGTPSGDLHITASEEAFVDDVKVYSHITEGGIYDIDGNEGPYLAGFRAMNAVMEDGR